MEQTHSSQKNEPDAQRPNLDWLIEEDVLGSLDAFAELSKKYNLHEQNRQQLETKKSISPLMLKPIEQSPAKIDNNFSNTSDNDNYASQPHTLTNQAQNQAPIDEEQYQPIP